MATCETSDETSSPAIGIVLVLLACCCYAFGNCLQRYSLLRQPGQKVFGLLNRHAGWLLGAIIYFSANFLYAIALSFAPVTVLAAVFSLTILANATCAVLLLGDKIPRLAYPGYVLVLAGSIVFSVIVNAQVCHFDGSELVDVMTTPGAIVFWIVLGGVILGGCMFAWRFEKTYPLAQEEEEEAATDGDSDRASAYVLHNDNGSAVEQDKSNEVEQKQDSKVQPSPAASNDVEQHSAAVVDDHDDAVKQSASKVDQEIDPRSLLFARFIYPASLGATEAVGALVLKAINSLLTTIATDEIKDDDDDEYFSPQSDEDYPDDLGLWIALFGVGIFLFLGIVMWLRLVYSRFEITGAFPVEFGMLTLASVVGGFAVFQDYKFVESAGDWVGVALAGAAILGGIGVVAYASWKAKVDEQNAAAVASAESSERYSDGAIVDSSSKLEMLND